MKKLILAILVSFSILMLLGCQEEEINHDIFVTVYPLEYMMNEITEGTSLTIGIVPGVSSHQDSIDWSPKEIIAMTEASLLIYVGANYDQYIDFQIESIFQNKDVELVKIENETDYITFIPGIIDDHDHHEDDTATEEENTLGTDPHFWISPKRLLDVAPLLFDKLVEKYPEFETTFTTNYNNLVASLTDLDNAFTEVISNQVTKAMFSTNLYGYLREDYGLEYLSISPGYHEETEVFTTQERDEIVADAINESISIIIYEKYSTSPLSNAIFDELELRGYAPIKREYDILQTLTDEDKSKNRDYISVMYENLELLKAALGYVEES